MNRATDSGSCEQLAWGFILWGCILYGSVIVIFIVTVTVIVSVILVVIDMMCLLVHEPSWRSEYTNGLTMASRWSKDSFKMASRFVLLFFLHKVLRPSSFPYPHFLTLYSLRRKHMYSGSQDGVKTVQDGLAMASRWPQDAYGLLCKLLIPSAFQFSHFTAFHSLRLKAYVFRVEYESNLNQNRIHADPHSLSG